MLGLTPSVRVAFVGDAQRFGPWALSAPASGLEPLFVRAPADDARRNLEAFGPDVVVVFDVDAVPSALYGDLGVPVLGVATSDAPAAPVRHRRRREARAALAPGAPAWTRLVALDASAARDRELWRLMAPPVDDALFGPPDSPDGRPQVTVLAPSTAYRERLLLEAKHRHDLRHVAHGITAATLAVTLAGIDVAVVLRAHEQAGFDHAVALHAAAGHLVICDHSGHGLEPGLDVLLARDTRAVAEAVGAVRDGAHVHHRVRVRGRLKAERFRASTVWPELIADLRADLGAFGPALRTL